MEKPEWTFGSEKRFYDYIGKLDEGRTAIISHTDLDGIGSAKIINEVVSADEILLINYNEINSGLADRIRALRPKKVIISDLFFKSEDRVIPSIEKFAEVLIVDHHSPDRDFNSDRTVHMNAQGFCAAYLAYSLLSKTQDIGKLDWLAACASMSDIAYFKNQEFMRDVFRKYDDSFEITPNGQLRKSGKMWDAQWKITLALVQKDPDYKSVLNALGGKFGDIGNLESLAHEVDAEYHKMLSRFEVEKEAINGGFFWELSPNYKITSLLSNEISFRHPDRTCIFLSPLGNGYKFSARRQDGQVNLNSYCMQLVKGFSDSSAGGHPKASGGNFPAKYLPEFKGRLGLN